MLKNVKIFTMGANGIIESGMILIEGSTIINVGRIIELPAGAWVMDLSGGVFIPGLIYASSSLFLTSADRAFLGDGTPDADILEDMDHYIRLLPDLLANA